MSDTLRLLFVLRDLYGRFSFCECLSEVPVADVVTATGLVGVSYKNFISEWLIVADGGGSGVSTCFSSGLSAVIFSVPSFGEPELADPTNVTELKLLGEHGALTIVASVNVSLLLDAVITCFGIFKCEFCDSCIVIDMFDFVSAADEDAGGIWMFSIVLSGGDFVTVKFGFSLLSSSPNYL